MHTTAILLNHILEYCAQVHGSKPSEEFLEVVFVDEEEAVGTVDIVGCGAKVLRGSSGLENISRPTGSTMTMVSPSRDKHFKTTCHQHVTLYI